MKIKKYLSTAIGLLEGMENVKHTHTADTVYTTLVNLEDYLKGKGLVYKKQDLTNAPHAAITLMVTDEDLKPIIAEVKFFPMKNTDSLLSFSKLDGRINFIRSYTHEDGTLSISLPAPDGIFAKYYVEISKGSEFEIASFETILKVGKDINVTRTLKRIANLKALNFRAGDLHHHSIYSSPVHGGTDDVIETPQEVAYSMQAAGLAFGALSDHHNIFNHADWQKTASSEFIPIISKEISTSNGHVMSLGVAEDVIYAIPNDNERTEGYLRAEFIRITDQIKALGGLAQINHPRDLSVAISLDPKFTDMIEIFETMEIWNGSNPMFKGTTNWAAFKLWLELLEEGRFIPATTGSDTHNTHVNDYNSMLDKITWLVQTVNPILHTLPSELQAEVTYFICLYTKTTPMLEKWAEDTLGSGCVRTYVHLKEEVSTPNILQALRAGHSFLTNGPILIPSIQNHLPGDTLSTSQKTVTIDLKLIANKPLSQLSIYTQGGKCETISLANLPKNTNVFDYSMQLKDFNIEETNWIFFIASSDCTNLAITNPIFIKH